MAPTENSIELTEIERLQEENRRLRLQARQIADANAYAAELMAELEDARETLEKKNAELEEAVKANDAKGLFLANMSHEIRTPLNAVIGLAHLTLKTELSGKQHDYITKMQASAKSLLGLINDILDFSKIEANKIDLECVPFNLDQILENLASIATHGAEEQDLEILFSTPVDIPRDLLGDPFRLSQTLVNLLNNAIKFTETGEIVVHTEVCEATEKEATLRFSVKDTGIGLTREQTETLFAEYSQADVSTSRKYGGTGLGLSICKRLVEMMGGTLKVESEKGKGSVFSFTCKLGRQQNHKKDRRLELPESLRNLRTLVVDDNELSRNILKDLLSSFAADVTLTDSGPAAIEELRRAVKGGEKPYDFAILDWKMPGMDGVEAATRIKNDPQLPVAPTIIMVTAFAREVVRRKAEEAGFEKFLVKPVSQSTLFDSIMELFGHEGHNASRRLESQKREQRRLAKIKGARILLAEDNEINQQVAREILETMGLHVVVAANGEEAVETMEHAEPGAFDAVLMDLQMPQMDGIEATRRLREKFEYDELPIIAMTANAMKKDRMKCFEAGMNDHLSKPINPTSLASSLFRWIKTKDRSQSADGREESISATAPPTAELPDCLPGIDIQDAMDRLGGNADIFLKVLLPFQDGYGDIVPQIRRAIDGGDLAKARHLAHDLKGIAGNLSAKGLYENALQLESAFDKEEDKGFAELLSSLEANFSEVSKSIRSIKK